MWVQNLIMRNIHGGVLTAPPPMMSRPLQMLANGMTSYQDALKISYVPFPFPYAQMCHFVLVAHVVLIPFVTAAQGTGPIISAGSVFLQVFVFWSLNLVAAVIETPFGHNINDMGKEDLQMDYNSQLLLLLQPETDVIPNMQDNDFDDELNEYDCSPLSLADVFSQLGPIAPPRSARATAFLRRCSSWKEEFRSTSKMSQSLSVASDTSKVIMHQSSNAARSDSKGYKVIEHEGQGSGRKQSKQDRPSRISWTLGDGTASVSSVIPEGTFIGKPNVGRVDSAEGHSKTTSERNPSESLRVRRLTPPRENSTEVVTLIKSGDESIVERSHRPGSLARHIESVATKRRRSPPLGEHVLVESTTDAMGSQRTDIEMGSRFSDIGKLSFDRIRSSSPARNSSERSMSPGGKRQGRFRRHQMKARSSMDARKGQTTTAL